MQVSNDTSKALTIIHSQAPIILVTGRAGTGKTTLIRMLMEQGGENQIVLAPTGVAAMNAGGQTIHSFFRIPPRLMNFSEITPRRNGRSIFKNLKRVIIDEISMVRADLLDAVNHALQVNRKDPRPFGGVQMVLVGDFLQLPPVVRPDEMEILEKMGYDAPFAFAAKSLLNNPVAQIDLSKIYRQEDPEFIRLLGNLRSGEELHETITILNEACLGPHKRKIDPIILTGTNLLADRYNAEGMNSLPGVSMNYEGKISGEFNLDKDKLPAPDMLSLKIGARIMMVKNDKEKKWVNGSLGTIVCLEPDRLWVNLDGHNGNYEVTRVSWENIRYEWDEKTEKIHANIVGTYSQIPVIPAWALTIHKSQGLTLDNVRIDIGGRAFASGQAYVALSRARSLEGLSFATPLRASDVLCDPILITYANRGT